MLSFLNHLTWGNLTSKVVRSTASTPLPWHSIPSIPGESGTCHSRGRCHSEMWPWASPGRNGSSWSLHRGCCTGTWCWRTTATLSPWVRRAFRVSWFCLSSFLFSVMQNLLRTKHVWPWVSVVNKSGSHLTCIICEFTSQVRYPFFSQDVNVRWATWTFCFLRWPKWLSISPHKQGYFSSTGCQVTKPAVISRLEQGQEPWMEEEEILRWSFPGERGAACGRRGWGQWTSDWSQSRTLGGFCFRQPFLKALGLCKQLWTFGPRPWNAPNDSCHLHTSHITTWSLSFPWVLEKDLFYFYPFIWPSHLRPGLLSFSLESLVCPFPPWLWDRLSHVFRDL